MEELKRPLWIDQLSEEYHGQNKNVVLLTGDVHGIFLCPQTKTYLRIEQSLFQALNDRFLIMRTDMAESLSFYGDADAQNTVRALVGKEKFGGFDELVNQTRHNPLAQLVLLKRLDDLYRDERRVKKELKPACFIIQFASAMLPSGELGKLSDIDRQRIVAFLNWIYDPAFLESGTLVILLSEAISELNEKIASLPNTAHVEIPLPARTERALFIDWCTKKNPVTFETTPDQFVDYTAGLSLVKIHDLVENASRQKKPITRLEIVEAINVEVKRLVHDIVRVKHVEHTSKDVIGYAKVGEIIRKVFKRCERRETAVSAILISGANGVGKTYQLEAFANDSNWIVIELAGLRRSYFGDTDAMMEKLRWFLSVFNKILILVDEAHAELGSVHKQDTHETEKRLLGNIIKLMGDPKLLSKVLWGLMTSRPDELPPDIKSRCAIQIPLFDLVGEERKEYIKELFGRKKIVLEEAELTALVDKTGHYSARDYRDLLGEVLFARSENPQVTLLEVVSQWSASKAILAEREMQALIAAKHCSYPELLPVDLRDEEVNQKRIEQLL